MNDVALKAAAVAAVMIDQYVTTPVSTPRAPKRSLSQPPGTWNSA